MSPDPVQEREAQHGSKMIEVRVRFWTDDIAKKGKIRPKHAWTSGVVRLASNASHGITGSKPRPFNSLLDIGGLIEAALVEQGIQLHPSTRMRKYITAG